MVGLLRPYFCDDKWKSGNCAKEAEGFGWSFDRAMLFIPILYFWAFGVHKYRSHYEFRADIAFLKRPSKEKTKPRFERLLTPDAWIPGKMSVTYTIR